MEWMAQRGLQIDTFTNHSFVSSDFGIPNEPSTPKKPRSVGDLPGSPAYWSDYARQAGIKFYWSYIPNRYSAYRRTFGTDNYWFPLGLGTGRNSGILADITGVPPMLLGSTLFLTDNNLDSLVRKNQFEIAFTHFGYWSDNSNRVNPELSPASITAFRKLKAYQDDGKILVAKTSRLLRYNLARDHVHFTSSEVDGRTIVDVTKIEDTQFGDFSPTLHDLRGLTFYVPDSSTAEIRICEVRLHETEIQRNPADQTGHPSIGIKWFEPDHTDYTTWTLSEVNQHFSR